MICSLFCALIRCIKCINDQQIHFNIIDVLLLPYYHQHVLSSNLAIFRIISLITRTQLFLLYLIHLPNANIHKATPILFADDSSILITSQNVCKFQDDLNTAFGQITKWCQINSLSLNLRKTYIVQFSSRSLNYFDINIMYENNQILKVTDIKFWGLHINNTSISGTTHRQYFT